MATRDELVVALAKRYRQSRRREKGRILDEFVSCAVARPTNGLVRDPGSGVMVRRRARRW